MHVSIFNLPDVIRQNPYLDGTLRAEMDVDLGEVPESEGAGAEESVQFDDAFRIPGEDRIIVICGRSDGRWRGSECLVSATLAATITGFCIEHDIEFCSCEPVFPC